MSTQFIGLVLLFLSAPPADHSAAPQAPDDAAAQREVQRDPWMPGLGRTAPPVRVSFRAATSVQVNVAANGADILGDAANEPSLAVDPTNPNRLAIGWRQFDNIASDFRQAGYAYSIDAGRSWTFPGVLDPGVFRSDPVLDSSPDGVFYYNSLTNTPSYACVVFTSTDGGQTWPAVHDAFGGDKAWMVVDRTAGTGRGFIYEAWSTAAGCCGLNMFTRSIDGGVTWMTPITIPSTPRWGTLAVGPDGDLYVAGRQPSNSANFLVARSNDAQNALLTPTFTTASLSLGGSQVFNLVSGPNPVGLLGQVGIGCDTSDGPRRGHLYVLCSVDPAGSDPMDVRFSRSTDGGVTWSASVRVNDDPATTNAWQWFGTLSVAPNGRIDVVWNDTRNTGVVNLSQLFYSFSNDGGLTWSPNQQLSPTWDSYVGWPVQQKIGDYYHMVSDNVGASLAWSATFNGGQDVYYLRIGDYDCNGNGVGDAQDLVAGTLTDFNGNGIPDTCERLGDMNCDGKVDSADVGPFLLAVVDPPGYAAAFPACSIANGDINASASTDLADAPLFATILTLP